MPSGKILRFTVLWDGSDSSCGAVGWVSRSGGAIGSMYDNFESSDDNT